MVSIRDVAKEAGVAISTVSKVLNNYPNITEATKDKVNRAIKELNYVPNSIAAALSSKNPGRIAVIMDPTRQGMAEPEVYMQFLLGALDCGKELNLDIITVFFSMLNGLSGEDIIRYLRSRGVQGILVFGLTQEDRALRSVIMDEEFNTVLIDVPFQSESITSVGIDHSRAQKEVALRALKESPGPLKNVLYVAGKGTSFVTAERTKGMKEAAEELGLTLSIRYGDFSEVKARGIAQVTGKDKDAVVCASDVMAIGVLKAFKELNISVPVCGFDGIALMGYLGEGMYTVKQDFYDIADTAVKEVKRLMEGESGRQVVMPHEVVKMKYLDVIK